jgi:large subunit ribosomal protein L7/L12
MPSKEDIIKQISDMSVKDLADLVKKLETEFGVSAAMPVAAQAAGAGAGEAVKAEEKSEYKVTLKETGSEKIKVIKALRALINGLSLTEAKEKAEGAPVVVADAAPKEEAEKMKKLLEEAGAKVELA